MKKFFSFVLCFAIMMFFAASAGASTVWHTKEYLDEFNMPIAGEKYYVCVVDGTFSNSATTNSKLSVAIFYDPDIDEIWFRFFEYGNHRVTAYKDTQYYFVMMNNAGEKFEWYSSYMWKNEDQITFSKKATEQIYTNMLKSFKEGGTIRFAFQEAKGTSKYVFSIVDDAGLSVAN